MVAIAIIPMLTFAQADDTVAESDTIYDPIRVVYADKFVADNNSEEAKQFYTGDVKIVHDSTFFQCDSAVTSETFLVAFDNVTIIKSDTIETFSNILHYDAINEFATLVGDVAVINGQQELYTDTCYYDLVRNIVSYPDTALMLSENSKLSSRNGRYELDNKFAYFYQDVVVIDSAFTLLTDTLHYDIASSKASFFGPSFITQEATQIYAEKGYYNTDTGDAFFEKNAKYNSETGKATSDIMRYLPDESKVILEGNPIVKDSSYYATADRIEYDDQDSTIVMVGNAFFKDDESRAQGETIKLNQKTGDIEIFGDGWYQNGDTELSSDTILYNEKTKVGKTTGKSVFTDNENDRRLYADHLDYKADGSYIAYNDTSRPYIEQVDDGDTTYLAADTLYSYSVPRDSTAVDSIEYFIGYPNVRIFSDRFQAVADSLSYALQDSMLTLFGNPIAWADTSQFAGDTVVMKNDDEGISDIHLYGKANIINYLDDRHQDQIKGKTIHAELDSQSMKHMNVVGNAETIYFLRDEVGHYIGANKTICSYINFWFEEGELSDVKFHGEPVSEMNPIGLATDEALYLSDIKWDESKRPRSKDDLLTDKINTLGIDPEAEGNGTTQELETDKEVDTFEAKAKEALKRNKGTNKRKK
jgi:lipopolysaccharide export system protein LptA